MSKLTLDDHQRMHQEGWCVDLHDDGFRLMKPPVTERFKDDAAVWLHVIGQAIARDELALRVLAFLQEHGPLEFRCIGHFVALYQPSAVEYLEERRRAA